MTKNSSMLTTTEAGKLLSVCPSTVRKWADLGMLPCYVLGSRKDRRFSITELAQFLGSVKKMGRQEQL